MNNKKDLQSSKDTRKITIDKVGVKNIRYPIIVEDRQNQSQATVAELDIYVELLHEHRGTHMSRFIEVLTHFHKDNLIARLPDFLLEIKKALCADSAYTSLRFPYFIEKIAPVSKIPSLLAYDCFFEASYQKDYSLTIGVHVPITTLCPCSQEISDYGAHNQRSIVTVKVTLQDFIWIEEIIEIVESCASCEIFSLLKRSDEKYVTEKAFDNPRFVEDLVREVTLRLKDDKRISEFMVESENFESIHSHNAYACVKVGDKS
jgi:GTP cyclohydrolase IB